MGEFQGLEAARAFRRGACDFPGSERGRLLPKLGGRQHERRVRLKAEVDQLREEVAQLREASRIKDARMARIPAQRRPHYSPVERLEILQLRAACRWSLQRTADTFLVTPETIASWMKRLDEQGANTPVQIPEPVNRGPEPVRYLVQRLKVLCPTIGKVKIAETLACAGLHLGKSTVARILKEKPGPRPWWRVSLVTDSRSSLAFTLAFAICPWFHFGGLHRVHETNHKAGAMVRAGHATFHVSIPSCRRTN